MEGIKEDNVEELKNKLRNFKKEQLIFNEPHFTQQLTLREGSTPIKKKESMGILFIAFILKSVTQEL